MLRNKKSKPRKEVLVADGRTVATMPLRGGLTTQSMPECSMQLEYVTNQVYTGTISWKNLLDTVLVAASSTVGYDVFYSAKLHYVEVWTPPIIEGTASSAPALAYDSPSQGDLKVYNIPVSGMGGYCKCKPSKRSINGWTWQQASSITCFTLNSVTTGTFIRVSVTFRARMLSSNVATNALSGATAGFLYLRGLDGAVKGG